VEDTSETPPKQTWFGGLYDRGGRSVDEIELQRARLFELWVRAKGDLRKTRTAWREAVKRSMPAEVIADLAEAAEGLQDSVDDARESYAVVSAERDRRIADTRANLALMLSGAAFCVSSAALLLTLLAFLLKGWH
jgi:hypothetical protein